MNTMFLAWFEANNKIEEGRNLTKIKDLNIPGTK